MITITSNSILVFSFRITYYAILMVTGALLGAVLSFKEAKRRGVDSTFVWQVLPLCLILGFIGARFWHVFTPAPSILVDGKNPYFLEPLRIFNIKQGGLGVPGAVIGGILAIWIQTCKNKMRLSTWLDIGAPGLALAQAIGRWGNFFNKELYGLPTKITQFPFSVNINGNYYLALFFYEFIWNLFNMFLLLWLPRKFGDRMKPGDNALVYLIVYPVGRFFLEFLRIERASVGGIYINQSFMAVTAIAAAIALIVKHLKKKIPMDGHIPN